MAVQKTPRTSRPSPAPLQVRPADPRAAEDERREDLKDLAYVEELDRRGGHRWIGLAALKKKLGR